MGYTVGARHQEDFLPVEKIFDAVPLLLKNNQMPGAPKRQNTWVFRLVYHERTSKIAEKQGVRIVHNSCHQG
ncbi:hypothetical protein [Microseira wollei]|uniref:Transposase n=1 Tax=Microseira wollei NIES-4236 TaxID=2530354 RepID=A0AAV3XSU8_9CYAN|nr:hypothetical protein [Microseira wollei]GET44246.1 hypothetical protein MiSe_90720 [Microseira wollei NIES-4236]